MILGLSGKIKSGKNTVADMIVELTKKKNHKIIENEFGDPTRDKNGNYVTFPDEPMFEQRMFAGKLKEVASILTGIPKEKFEDQDFKMEKMDSEWANPPYNMSFPEKYIPTYREFLQRLGTETIRKSLHENAWVNAAMSDIDGKNIIFTDCRFPNEAAAIKDYDGVMIRINRYPPGCSPKLMNEHESEKSLDDWKFDHVIYNVGTLEDLWNQIREILNRYKLITKSKVNFAM